MMSTIGEYLKVARLHSAVLTGMTPVLGAIVTNYYNPIVLIILYFIGVCTHIFGFTLNEYLDLDIDRRSKDLKNKPLVKGTISKQAALTFAFGAIIVGYILIFILINFFCCPGFFATIFYTLSWLAIGIYDLTSKKLRGTDIILALWIGLLGLFGGFAVSTAPDERIFIIAALAFFQLWIQNVLAGLKDVQHDELAHGTTASLRMGVRLEYNRLIVPLRFQTYLYFLKFMHAFVILQAFLNFCFSDNPLQVYLVIILILVVFLIVFHIFNMPVYNREELLRAIGLHEILSYSIVIILIYELLLLPLVIIFLLIPIVWLAVFMKIMYGRLLPEI